VSSGTVLPLNLGDVMEIDCDQVLTDKSPPSLTSEYSASPSLTTTNSDHATSPIQDSIPSEIIEVNPRERLLQIMGNIQSQFQDSQMMIMPAEPCITTPTHQTEPQSLEIVLRRQNAIENLDELEYMVFVNHLFYITLLTSCRMVSTLKRRYPLGSTRRTA
jgi:hypothetical protein